MRFGHKYAYDPFTGFCVIDKSVMQHYWANNCSKESVNHLNHVTVYPEPNVKPRTISAIIWGGGGVRHLP